MGRHAAAMILVHFKPGFGTLGERTFYSVQLISETLKSSQLRQTFSDPQRSTAKLYLDPQLSSAQLSPIFLIPSI